MKKEGFNNLKLESVTENSTGRVGLPFIWQSLDKMDLLRDFSDANFDRRQKRKTYYERSDSLMTLVLTLIAGGNCVEDVNLLREDKGLASFENLPKIPSPDTIFRALEDDKMRQRTQRIFHTSAFRTVKKSEVESIGIDHDATYEDCEKPFATSSYLEKHQMSLCLAYVVECGVIIEADLRPGNISPRTGILEQVKNIKKKLDLCKKKFGYFRSDSAAYQAETLDFLNNNGTKFYVSAKKVPSLISKADTTRESEWIELPVKKMATYSWHALELTHKMRVPSPNNPSGSKSDLLLRMLVLRKIPHDEFFPRYYMICTNDWEISIEDWVKFHSARMGTENKYKELKRDFSCMQLPSNNLNVSSNFCFAALIAFNLLSTFQRVVLKQKHRRIKKIGQWFINIQGRLVSHARQFVCKLINVTEESFSLFERVLNFIQGAEGGGRGG